MRLRERLEIEQTAIAVNRGQTVAELVGDPRGHLTQARERFFHLQLLPELDDRGQIGEETDRPLLRRWLPERRHRDAEVTRDVAALRVDDTPRDRTASRKAFGDHVRERRTLEPDAEVRAR